MNIKQRDILNELPLCFPNDKAKNNREQWCKTQFAQRAVKLKDYCEQFGVKNLVLGMSGGLDSFIVGNLAAITGIKCTFLMLPYKDQKDIKDAYDAIRVISNNNPNTEIYITEDNIYKAVEEAFKEICTTTEIKNNIIGNTSARMRMLFQYIEGEINGTPFLVLGTDHATESVVGYFTKYGDGGTDYNPIDGLLKSDLYIMAKQLNAPQNILTKAPAAGLGITDTDEEELGLSYINDIVPFLEGFKIDEEKTAVILDYYKKTMHKRMTPISPLDPLKAPKHRTHIIIDCVNDFITGSLACLHAEKAVQNIINYINEHPNDKVIYIAETHPGNHCSFNEHGGIWPAHAVRGTDGAELHENFYTHVRKITNTPIDHFNVFRKGLDPEQEEYSAINAKNDYWGPLLDNLSKDEEIVVSGIATEYCVKETVKDLLKEGFNVSIIEDNLGYVNYADHKSTLAQWKENNKIKLK